MTFLARQSSPHRGYERHRYHEPAPEPLWIQLASGAAFNIEGAVSPLKIEDVAASLSRICRFGGACRDHYSVAQHSFHVTAVVRRLAPTCPDDGLRYALLHDAHEMVLSDIVSPVKALLKRFEHVAPTLDWFEKDIDRRIFEGLGYRHLMWMSQEYPLAAIVKQADTIMLGVERRDLMPGGRPWASVPPAPRTEPPVTPWPAKVAERMFLEAWERLE